MVAMIASPGKVDSHQASARLVAPAARSLPQSGAGSRTPRPRKLKVVAVRTPHPIALLPRTTTSVTRWGRRGRHDVRSVVEPNTPAASTYPPLRHRRTEDPTTPA